MKTLEDLNKRLVELEEEKKRVNEFISKMKEYQSEVDLVDFDSLIKEITGGKVIGKGKVSFYEYFKEDGFGDFRFEILIKAKVKQIRDPRYYSKLGKEWSEKLESSLPSWSFYVDSFDLRFGKGTIKISVEKK